MVPLQLSHRDGDLEKSKEFFNEWFGGVPNGTNPEDALMIRSKPSRTVMPIADWRLILGRVARSAIWDECWTAAAFFSGGRSVDARTASVSFWRTLARS